ncbi:unnamed protein product [Microthlaspi erraticum]|uniref:non-specific serine/threonine protein kinase n=1 Tax=Microthlaspi erraticum TaxID=1685480 RepID=A0A6D2KZ98_9BRAS|nr:unnamed protein product [Microthlaspi erraticum]
MGCCGSKNLPLSGNILILGKPFEDIKKLYRLGKVLGKGSLGKTTTYMCQEISTGKRYACKSIPKKKISNKEAVKKEIQIMNQVSGHDNIVEIKAVYEDAESIHIVMELCGGGELSDRIEANSYYSEKDSAGILSSIVNALQIFHSIGVIHRDVKPKNFLFLSEDDDVLLKAIGFGSCVYIKEVTGIELKGEVGSKHYVAPEVLRGRSSGKEIDIWSAGVILYQLLCGKQPFETEDEIRQGTFDLESQPWPCVSMSAKDLIKKMLTNDPKKRISASDVLEHPWIKSEAANNHTDHFLVSRMKRFGSMSKLTKLAFKVIAEGLAEEEVKDLKTRFKDMDIDQSGSITYGELRAGLSIPEKELSMNEAKQLMEAADLDGNGRMDIEEFVSATMERQILDKDENVHKAFQHFDKDGNGYITKDELERVMMEHGVRGEPNAKEMISEADKDNDGRLDHEEFCTMMRRNRKLQPQGKLLGIH